jgi:hypothetical protein
MVHLRFFLQPLPRAGHAAVLELIIFGKIIFPVWLGKYTASYTEKSARGIWFYIQSSL